MTIDAPKIVLHFREKHKDQQWLDCLRKSLPFDVITQDEVKDPALVKYCIIGQPEPGFFAQYPNLQAIFSQWAGVDGIVSMPDFPHHIALYRMIEDGMTQGMQDYVLAQIFYYHLDMQIYAQNQADKIWCERESRLAQDRKIGFMGLGALGGHIANTAHGLGFCVNGWRATNKPIQGVKTFHGMDQLPEFLGNTEILVSLLPSNDDTRDILNADTLRCLPKGAAIINAGRGEAINESDLLAAIDAGHISGATLDVFHQEPIGNDHPFWHHDKIRITPHIASQTRVESGTQSITRNIMALENGKPGIGLYDRKRRY